MLLPFGANFTAGFDVFLTFFNVLQRSSHGVNERDIAQCRNMKQKPLLHDLGESGHFLNPVP